MVSPGQRRRKQSWSCVSGPGQRGPPCAGAGLVQSRGRVWLPFPHVVLHGPQGPQGLHSPATARAAQLNIAPEHTPGISLIPHTAPEHTPGISLIPHTAPEQAHTCDIPNPPQNAMSGGPNNQHFDKQRSTLPFLFFSYIASPPSWNIRTEHSIKSGVSQFPG